MGRVKDILFPRVDCMLCEKTAEPSGGLCPACRAALDAMPPLLSPGFLGALPYEGACRELIRALKYGGEPDLASEYFAARMAALPLSPADMAVPVPLHRGRLAKRGYNQSEFLARKLAARLGLPVCNAVQRVRATEDQTRLGGEARRQNARGAFRVRRRYAKALRGARVLLVDDVRTTGATTEACAEALRAAGAEVRVLCAAYAVIRG